MHVCRVVQHTWVHRKSGKSDVVENTKGSQPHEASAFGLHLIFQELKEQRLKHHVTTTKNLLLV